jgi:hypothetical protein
MSDDLRQTIYLNFSQRDTDDLLKYGVPIAAMSGQKWPSTSFERDCMSDMSNFPYKAS